MIKPSYITIDWLGRLYNHFLMLFFEDKIDQPKLNSIFNELLELHYSAYFLKFFHKNICILHFDKFGKHVYDLRFNFKIDIDLWQSDTEGWADLTR